MHFLIADASPEDVERLRIEFERQGHGLASRRADTEVDMSDKLHTAHWDMVISDDSMPCLNSLQALDVVKKSGLDVPFIIYAATMNHRVEDHGLHFPGLDSARAG